METELDPLYLSSSPTREGDIEVLDTKEMLALLVPLLYLLCSYTRTLVSRAPNLKSSLSTK